jgi:hypothetical protein
MRLVVSLAVVVALGSPAGATTDVGVIVTGEGSIQPQLTAQLGTWLTQHGYTLIASPLPPEAITALVDCFATEDQRCARRVMEQRARPATMVYARIDSRNNLANGTREITLTAYLFERGRDTVAERKTCDQCTDQLLRSTADDIMNKLVGSNPGHVKLTSTPRGARIAIDGKPIGVTPLDWDLLPGKHRIELSKQGFVPVTREVVIERDKTAQVTAELRQAESVAPGGRSRVWKVGAMALGGALVVTGGVLIGIHQDKVPSEPAEVYTTRTPGIALAAGGLAVAAVGAYFLWFRSDDTKPVPIAAFTGDAGYVGWLQRF